MDKLSVIIPAYNEGKSIRKNCEAILDSLSKYFREFEVILVNDGSRDNTLAEARQIRNPRLKVVSYEKNRGKGHALKYGFKFVRGNIVTFLDADLDLHPDQLKKFIPIMKKCNADMVVGSKRHPDSTVSYPFMRKFLSWGYQMLIYLLFRLNIRDTQSGLKVMKTSCLKKILPKVLVKGFAFDLELLVVAKKYGYTAVEAPIEINYQFSGSGVDAKAIRNIFVDTLGIAYRLYIMRYYDI